MTHRALTRQRTSSCPVPYIPQKYETLKKQQEARETETEQDRAVLQFAQRIQNKEKPTAAPRHAQSTSQITRTRPKGPSPTLQPTAFQLDLSALKPESQESQQARTESMSARDLLRKRQKTKIESQYRSSGAMSART